MLSFLHKRIIVSFLTIAFSLSIFGGFVNIAYAGIAADLATLLNIPEPSGVNELPSDLTPAQIATILDNIKNDPRVTTALGTIQNASQGVAVAEQACARILVAGCSPVIDGVNSVEATALDTANATLAAAISELEKALIAARNNQSGLIRSYQAENAVADLTNTTVGNITSTGEKTLTNNAQQGTTDATNAGAVPINQADIDAAIQARQNANAWNTDDSIAVKMGEQCVVFSFRAATNILPCVAEIVYKVVYKPTAYALMGSGWIFDKILSLSIEGPMVSPPFINEVWTVVRDFSNMIFIFILLYTGVMTILGEKNWKKTVLQVIFIALLINFSLFFTKVVIDAGNVLAVRVKSSINPGHSVSEGLAAAFQPQQFLKAAGKTYDAGDAIIVFIIAAVVSGYAAYIFFKAALLFMGRLIAFWFLMMISPFAFISTTFPKGNKFDKWISTLMGQAFVAPVFLFFIYIIMKVISAGDGILGGFSLGTKWFESLLGPVIVATLLIMALSNALEFAEDMAGSFGKTVSGLTGKVLGTAAGVATGGAALVGRSAGGRLAQKIQENGTFQKLATSENALSRFAGRQGMNLTDKARTGTWDARGVGLVQKGAKNLGLDVGKPGETAKGGFEGAIKRQEQADLSFAKKLKVTDEEKAAITGSAREQVILATTVVSEKKKAEEIATKNVTEAQIAHDAMRNSGLQDSKINQTLANAKKEAEAAKTAREEAEASLKKATDIAEEASQKIKNMDSDRQKSYANYIESKTRTGIRWVFGDGTYSHKKAMETAEKLREGGDKAKPKEKDKDLQDAIETAIKKEVEKREKEGK